MNGIFAGPGGKPCASIEAESYFISDQPGEWLPLTQAGVFRHLRGEGGRTLLYGIGSYKNHSDAAVMIDPARKEPEPWLGPLAALQKSGSPGSEKIIPPLPEWAAHSVWTQEERAELRSSDYGFRGDDLFGLVIQDKASKSVALVWYRRGRARAGAYPSAF